MPFPREDRGEEAIFLFFYTNFLAQMGETTKLLDNDFGLLLPLKRI